MDLPRSAVQAVPAAQNGYGYAAPIAASDPPRHSLSQKGLSSIPHQQQLPLQPPPAAQLQQYMPSYSRPRYSNEVEYQPFSEKHDYMQSYWTTHQSQSQYAQSQYSPPQHTPVQSRSPSGLPSRASVPGTSVSSAGHSSVMTSRTVDTIDLEKGAIVAPSRNSNIPVQSGDSRRSSKREMAQRQQPLLLSQTGPPSAHRASLPLDQGSIRSEMDEDEMLEQRRLLESKALKILLFLSAPCAALSFVLCLWSLIAAFGILLVAPFRLCTKPRYSLWEQILSTLTSAQRLQLRCIYAPTENVIGKCVASLVLNLMLSPFLSMGVALAAWTVAIYWIFAAIVGDPDGTEGGDDGVATVLGLRKWWESWLLRAVIEAP